MRSLRSTPARPGPRYPNAVAGPALALVAVLLMIGGVALRPGGGLEERARVAAAAPAASVGQIVLYTQDNGTTRPAIVTEVLAFPNPPDTLALAVVTQGDRDSLQYPTSVFGHNGRTFNQNPVIALAKVSPSTEPYPVPYSAVPAPRTWRPLP